MLEPTPFEGFVLFLDTTLFSIHIIWSFSNFYTFQFILYLLSFSSFCFSFVIKLWILSVLNCWDYLLLKIIYLYLFRLLDYLFLPVSHMWFFSVFLLTFIGHLSVFLRNKVIMSPFIFNSVIIPFLPLEIFVIITFPFYPSIMWRPTLHLTMLENPFVDRCRLFQILYSAANWNIKPLDTILFFVFIHSYLLFVTDKQQNITVLLFFDFCYAYL